MLVKNDIATRRLYATDASVYEELPKSVAFPENNQDCIALVRAASENKTPLIFRAAGTSIAGQCVGGGQVVDVSRFMTGILGEPSGTQIRVQPGVIHSDLDLFLKPFGLKFAPEISTSNRCMIGGMIGNNAAGSHSVIYGTTREHVVEIEAVLADGSVAEFGPLTNEQLQAKFVLTTKEGQIYRTVTSIINKHRPEILKCYPKPEIIRRNTGFPLDVLANGQPWNKKGSAFNLAPFLCGTEGVLALTLSATLNLVKAPKAKGLSCIHFKSLNEAMLATPIILKHQPAAIELMDKRLLDLTQWHIEHSRNRGWIEGNPNAILAVEFFGDSDFKISDKFKKLTVDLQKQRLGYAYPVISSIDAKKVWAIRKAGLGLLMGVKNTKKPVAVIEDAAVAPSDLAAYVEAIGKIMVQKKVDCVYYGHASVGLLHLRPELDLANSEDRVKFVALAEAVAGLIKRFNGSLSGEHGDGRLRGLFLKKMLGAEIFNCHVQIKKAFDPDNIFNPGKILTGQAIDQSLRVTKGDLQWQGKTGFDWSGDLGLSVVVEKCNGAAACRKSAGDGTLCPSYHATGEELYNTRGRSNLLRFLMRSGSDFGQELLNPDLIKSMDYCLSCKACKSECPSSVDMARLKAEYLYQRRIAHGLSFKDRGVLFYAQYLRIAARFPVLANKLQMTIFFKRMAGVSTQRALPRIAENPFMVKAQKDINNITGRNSVILLVDIFNQYQTPNVAHDACRLLQALGFAVHPVLMKTSPRQLISQGLLAEAKSALQELLVQFHGLPSDYSIIGLEPSELLVLRDELVDLVGAGFKDQALQAKDRALLLEEFLSKALVDNKAFDKYLNTRLNGDPVTIAIHNHCHQKSLVGSEPTNALFNALPGVKFSLLKTGCCGMAGQLGYENPAFSERVAQTSFLPAIAALDRESILIAAGCSCRAQAALLTGIKVVHPATFLASRLLSD